jgi:23S rRNA (cytosine1962-C5)-methyltransferase
VTATYTLLDAGDFRKLEQIGPFKIIRPSPQAVWSVRGQAWGRVDAEYHRFSGGDGEWKYQNQEFKKGVVVTIDRLKLILRPTDFGHLGIFPEQRQTWKQLDQWVRQILTETSECRVLNLFAYTGGSTLACASAGANVVHIDASKTSVAWARENAQASGLDQAPIRWIVEDVKKFIGRELKRGSRYHGIILDPPSYGRGNKAEVWKIESDLNPLMAELAQLLVPTKAFIALSAHSQGYTPAALKNILLQTVRRPMLEVHADEMLVAAEQSQLLLPSGAGVLAMFSQAHS